MRHLASRPERDCFFPDPALRGACSSAWSERTPDKREVDGSNPSRPTRPEQASDGGVAQLGERLPCTQEAIGSNPFTSTTKQPLGGLEAKDRAGGWSTQCCSLTIWKDIKKSSWQMSVWFVPIFLWPSY